MSDPFPPTSSPVALPPAMVFIKGPSAGLTTSPIGSSEAMALNRLSLL